MATSAMITERSHLAPPPGRATDARGAAAYAGRNAGDLRALAEAARSLGADGAANLLVPHVVLPLLLLDEPSQTGDVTTALGCDGEDFELAATGCAIAAGNRLTGFKRLVSGGLVAERVLVSVDLGGAQTLGVVNLDAPGVSRRGVTTIGRGPDADIDFRSVEVEILDPAKTAARLPHALTVATIIQAAEGAGMLDRLIEMSVSQGTERFAFGRPVGSFQAFQHACADMAMDRELSDAVVDRAIASQDERDASRARAFVARAAVRASRTAIQLQGGQGFLDDHPVSRLYRLAKEAQLRWGSEVWHLRRIARWLGESPSTFSADTRPTPTSDPAQTVCHPAHVAAAAFGD
jgi:alkylation response protein AidB-like acyl-CoA dehydrogenase